MYGGAVVIIVSWLTTNYSNILNVYGGGGKLLGGTYLIILYIGMIAGACQDLFPKKRNLLLAFLFFVLVVLWWRFECKNNFAIDRKLPFGGGFNPPSVSSITMALLVSGFLYNFEIAIRKKNCFEKLGKLWAKLGTHTLYIFLYHRFFLDYILCRYQLFYENIWLKRCSYMLVLIFGPIFIELFFRSIKNLFLKYTAEGTSLSGERNV